MRSRNELAGVDLNLLTVLDALLAERHVTRAALRLNKTQPAISHALSRLRVLFDDPILIRGKGGLEPTARALELEAPLRDALATLGGLLEAGVFDPRTVQRRFRVSMSDYSAEVMLPGLVRRISRSAPGAALALVSLGRDAALAAVRAGEIDLAIGVYPTLGTGADDLRVSPLFEDEFACLVDEAVGPPRTLADYLSRPHVAVAASPEDRGEVNAALTASGHTRRVTVTLPHWSVAPRILRGTNLVLTAARRSLVARLDDGLALAPPPFKLPPIPLKQVWHTRRDHDEGLRWIRRRIEDVVQSASKEGRSGWGAI